MTHEEAIEFLDDFEIAVENIVHGLGDCDTGDTQDDCGHHGSRFPCVVAEAKEVLDRFKQRIAEAE